MGDSVLVEVVDSIQDLNEETARMEIIETTRGENKVEGLAILAKLRHNIRVLLVFDLLSLNEDWRLPGVLYAYDIVVRGHSCRLYLGVNRFDSGRV